MKNNILIYTDLILPYSATFISEQIKNLNKYQPKFFGSVLNDQLDISHSDIIAYNDIQKLSKLQRGYCKLTGKFPKEIDKQIRSYSPSLIHAHFAPDGLWILGLKKRLKIPLITTIHSSNIHFLSSSTRLSYKYYVLNRKRLFESGDYFIAVSEFIKKELLLDQCPEEKIFRHYIGVDTKKFSPSPSIHRNKTVLYVGRLIEYKGCQDLLRAMQIVQIKSPDTSLVIIGDGILRSSLEKQAKNLRLNCHFLGIQPPHKVKEWMNRSKIFCMPSFRTSDGKAEAFGMVFAEAQSMGLPVVSYYSGGIPEVVIHNQTGFLAQEKNYQQLSSYILKLLENQSLWQKFSNNARLWIQKNFDIEKQTKILENFYDSILKKNSC